MPRTLVTLLFGLTLILGVLPGAAIADVRSGHFDDPMDMSKDVNSNNEPDMSGVQATYDGGAGSVTLTGSLYESATGGKPSNYWYSAFLLSVDCMGVNDTYSNSTPGNSADMTLSFYK